jgi:hypothetical protein
VWGLMFLKLFCNFVKYFAYLLRFFFFDSEVKNLYINYEYIEEKYKVFFDRRYWVITIHAFTWSHKVAVNRGTTFVGISILRLHYVDRQYRDSCDSPFDLSLHLLVSNSFFLDIEENEQ